jgi:hypothetical protein
MNSSVKGEGKNKKKKKKKKVPCLRMDILSFEFFLLTRRVHGSPTCG